MEHFISSIGKKDRFLLISSRVILLISILSLILFTLHSYRHRFHSDAATAGMIALEQWRTGELFVHGWSYSQDFWPMFVFNSVTLFFPIVHDAFLATQIGILFQTTIIFILSRQILIYLGSVTSANLILAFLLSGVSYLWSEFFYGQGQYGNVLMFLLIETVLMIKLLSFSKNGLMSWASAAFFLVNCYVNSTSVRYLAFFVGPSLVSLAYIFIFQEQYKKRIFGISTSLLISTCCGQALLMWLKHSYTFISGADGATFVSYHDALSLNLPRVIDGYFSLIVDGAVGIKFASIAGVMFVLRFVFCAIFFSAPFYFLLSKYKRMLGAFNATEKYLVVYFCGLAFISIFSVLFLASTVNIIAAARYMMLAIFFGIFVTIIFTYRLKIKNINLIFLIFMLPAFIFNVKTLNEGFNRGSGERQQLVDFLLANKLDRGFATYWNADVLTVLSDYKVMIAHIESDRLAPSIFMSTNEFYKPVGAHKNFLLLENSEIPKFDFESIRKAIGEPNRILRFNNYQIFVYKDEFAAHMPGWF